MKSRREFLKEAATGAVLLGSKSALGMAEQTGPGVKLTGKSKVVIARDPLLHAARRAA